MTTKTDYECRRVGQSIRCECGGQLAVGGTLHPLVDLGFGFVVGRFKVNVRHNMKKISGFSGFCMKCRKEGRFFLPGKGIK